MIYLDHASTTPLRGEVLEAMQPYLTSEFGNPSGVHSYSRKARRAVDDSRELLAGVLACEPREIVFTSGGTESDNLAVKGAVLGALAGGKERALTCCSAVEHPAVAETVSFLGGAKIPVDENGVVDLAALEAFCCKAGEDLSCVSLMLANNETGVIEPLEEASEIVTRVAPGALLHTDAVQAFGWCDLSSMARRADLVSLSAHKIGGPKGTGALVVRASATARLLPLLNGGPQERERRAGTENVAGIVGFARAAELSAREQAEEAGRVAILADDLVSQVVSTLGEVHLAGGGAARLPSIVNLGIPGIESEELLFVLDEEGVAASAGSACASGALEESPVLLAMGLSAEMARSHVRFSLSSSTTSDEIREAADAVARAVTQLRAA